MDDRTIRCRTIGRGIPHHDGSGRFPILGFRIPNLRMAYGGLDDGWMDGPLGKEQGPHGCPHGPESPIHTWRPDGVETRQATG